MLSLSSTSRCSAESSATSLSSAAARRVAELRSDVRCAASLSFSPIRMWRESMSALSTSCSCLSVEFSAVSCPRPFVSPWRTAWMAVKRAVTVSRSARDSSSWAVSLSVCPLRSLRRASASISDPWLAENREEVASCASSASPSSWLRLRSLSAAASLKPSPCSLASLSAGASVAISAVALTSWAAVSRFWARRSSRSPCCCCSDSSCAASFSVRESTALFWRVRSASAASLCSVTISSASFIVRLSVSAPTFSAWVASRCSLLFFSCPSSPSTLAERECCSAVRSTLVDRACSTSRRRLSISDSAFVESSTSSRIRAFSVFTSRTLVRSSLMEPESSDSSVFLDPSRCEIVANLFSAASSSCSTSL
mmetsp:Transcript_48027/g.114313  ORF Transcript_48027/g.114313 Transcript_48027/m.114313 type:complete len:367 (-) Transcript_48027:1561-2661(-)